MNFDKKLYFVYTVYTEQIHRLAIGIVNSFKFCP